MTEKEAKNYVRRTLVSSLARTAMERGIPPDDILSTAFAKVLIENTMKAYDIGGIVSVIIMNKKLVELLDSLYGKK